MYCNIVCCDMFIVIYMFDYDIMECMFLMLYFVYLDYIFCCFRDEMIGWVCFMWKLCYLGNFSVLLMILFVFLEMKWGYWKCVFEYMKV